MTHPETVTATVTGPNTIDLSVTSVNGNETTKSDLFSRAKDAIETGDQSLQHAAQALTLAQEDFEASQREMADAIGKSVAWVNRLLTWKKEGCVGSPFGPASKKSREQRKRVQST